MKKFIFIIAIIAFNLTGFISCKLEPANNSTDNENQNTPAKEDSGNTPPSPAADDDTVYDPDVDTTNEDPGNMDKCILNLTIPEGINRIYIFKKKSTETEWYYAIDIMKWDNNYPEFFQIEDPFVTPGETYNYKVQFFKYHSSISMHPNHAFYVYNGDTRNFTPSQGYGEIEIEQFPKYTLSSDKLFMKLDEPIHIKNLDVSEEYQNAITYFSDYHFQGGSTDFENITEYDFRVLFSDMLGKKRLDKICPAYYISGDEYLYSFCSKGYDISYENILIDYDIDTISLKNTSDGINCSLVKKYYENWTLNENSEMNISIYEDNHFICNYQIPTGSYCFNSGILYFNEFVFPLTKKGSQYKFIFNMNNSKITEKSIVADQTTPLTVNLDKLNNITEMETIIEDIDTEYGIVKTIKLSKPGMDIFNRDFKTEDWKYYDFSLYFYNENNNEIGELTLYSCYNGTDNYQDLSSGEVYPFYYFSSDLNLFTPLNEGTKFYIKAQFRINFDEHCSIGYLCFDSKKSDLYTWNTSDF